MKREDKRQKGEDKRQKVKGKRQKGEDKRQKAKDKRGTVNTEHRTLNNEQETRKKTMKGNQSVSANRHQRGIKANTPIFLTTFICLTFFLLFVITPTKLTAQDADYTQYYNNPT